MENGMEREMDKGGMKWKYGTRKAAENIHSLGAVGGDVCAGEMRIND